MTHKIFLVSEPDSVACHGLAVPAAGPLLLRNTFSAIFIAQHHFATLLRNPLLPNRVLNAKCRHPNSVAMAGTHGLPASSPLRL